MANVMRHVIGGRPQGWNYAAGQIQGWGGIDIGMYECLTRTGPLFEIKAKELEPMPNLAKSWDWSDDGHQLTMHLIEGAKWSDGVAVQRRRRHVLLGRQHQRSRTSSR